MIELQSGDNGKILSVKVSEKLTTEDYEKFVPQIEELIKKHGKIRVLFHMHEFHGWTVGALWQDIKFDLKHFGDIERLAMVGDRKWEAGMAAFCKPFTTAKIRYFDVGEIEQARQWIEEGAGSPAAS